MDKIILIVCIIALLMYLIKRGFGTSDSDQYQRNGFNYAHSIYVSNAKDEASHKEILKRIYNESEVGFEFAGGSSVDKFDTGMREFYWLKKEEGFIDV